MPLTLKKKQNQTWLEVGLDQAKSYGLGEEFLSAYHTACYDWDILDYQQSQEEDHK